MNHTMKHLPLVMALLLLTACKSPRPEEPPASMAEGTFTYSLPCKVININSTKPGKALLCIWLHGGVHVRSLHNLLEHNHLDCAEADDRIVDYLRRSGEKAIVLMPLCYRAVDENVTEWNKCWTEVKWMIDEYIAAGCIDEDRIYLTGASDGGAGTWDFVEEHGEIFASAMPMSCSRPRKSSIPVYFFNTSDERDCTEDVKALNEAGSNIYYKYSPDYLHGDDYKECTDELLGRLFSHRRRHE